MDGNSDVGSADWNHLGIEGMPEGLEKIYDYEAGGHHPVHLGDELGTKSKYRVMHKLGTGGFGNVWLCRALNSKTSTYVALKVLVADQSPKNCRELRVVDIQDHGMAQQPGGQYLCLPLDNFTIEGPNGTHLCFVYPFLGHSVASYTMNDGDHDHQVRDIAYKVAQAMAYFTNMKYVMEVPAARTCTR